MSVVTGRARWLLLGLLGLILLGTIIPQPSAPGQPLAVNGVLDLRAASEPFRHNPVLLDGEWSLIWNELLDQQAVSARTSSSLSSDMVALPGFLRAGNSISDHLRTHGYATLALTVQLPDGYGPVALRLPPIFSAYHVWVNGQSIGSAGTVGTSRDTTLPQLQGSNLFILPEYNSINLVLQIANFHDARMGLVSSITLGPAAQVAAAKSSEDMIWASMALILCVVGLQSILVYRGAPKSNEARLWLGLVLLINGIVSAQDAGLILNNLPAGWGWELNRKVWYSLQLIILPVAVLMVRSFFPAESVRGAVRGTWVITLPLLALVIFTPAGFYTAGLPVLHVTNIIVVIYAMAVGGHAFVRRRTHAMIVTMGGFAILLWMIMEWGRVYGVDQLSFWVTIAAAALLAIAVVGINSLDYQNLSESAGTLKTENENLVEALQRQLHELQIARQLIVEHDELILRKMGEFLHSRVQSKLHAASHYLSAIRESLQREPDSAVPLLAKVEEIMTDVRDNDIRFVSHRLYPILGSQGIQAELEAILSDVSSQYDVKITVDPALANPDHRAQDPENEPARLTCYRILMEALTNIQAHAKATQIVIQVGMRSEHTLELIIQDNGIGFDAGSTVPGLGTRLIQARLAEFGGSLDVESQPGSGTLLRVLLPLLPVA